MLVKGWIKACSGDANQSNDGERGKFAIYSSLSFDKCSEASHRQGIWTWQIVGEDMSQKDLAEWALKNWRLTTLPSQLIVSRFRKKRSHAHDERVVNPNRKRKSEGMHPEIEKALLTWFNKNHAHGLNLSSEMIKMGVRILDGVHEMRPNEKKIHLTLSKGPLWTSTRNAQEAGRRLVSDKHRVAFDNIMHFQLRSKSWMNDR